MSSLSEDAYALQIWGFPIIFAQRMRIRFTSPLEPHARRAPTSAGAALNRMGHQRRLSDPTLTAGVAPNVDTLYSLAFIDLESGDFELHLPDFADRYYSVQIGEADSSTNTVLGRRTHGSRIPPIKLVRMRSPHIIQTEGLIECRSRFIMIAIRILVDPNQIGDTQRVIQLQNQIVLNGPPTPPEANTALVTRNRDDELYGATGFLDSLEHALTALDDVPDWVGAAHRRLRKALAVRPADLLSTEQAISRGLTAGLDDIRAHVTSIGRTINGWAINDAGSEFRNDYMLRAAVAYSQIYINPSAEALYPICEHDEQGRKLHGKHGYTITFSAGSFPPADFFWSMTVYHAQGLLYPNELNRYAITDRTPQLRHHDDGSLTIRIQTDRPTENTESNWLPCPPDGFRLMLRLYGPTPGSHWSPPPVIRLTPTQSGAPQLS
ncbi:DUF1214 domain-containing protein (plasmid) [Rhodococcus qingshengii]|uniref:DUF1254 domain-containing protein n=1 Tax=Rhodococcus qingshengii TaxID=334542 RepID=UPI00211370C2|nr:DUF1214 domain-containing protein [Rhodococcus qingshengii]UUE28372.1 DUF1214 domain-containing protein [Rhodococcus qingshengii]